VSTLTDGTASAAPIPTSASPATSGAAVELAPITARQLDADITDPLERHESSEPKEHAEPTERHEANDPTDPTDATEPTDPTDSIEPRDAIERVESSDHSDQRALTRSSPPARPRAAPRAP
jgi:hypothetical protein